MISEYLCESLHILVLEQDTLNILEIILQISDILINASILIGGVWAISQIKKLREKRIDSTFSYLLRLQIRLKNLSHIFEKYNDYILDCLTIPTARTCFVDADNAFASKLTTKFSKDASETFKFLMDMDDQIPLDAEWIEHYNVLIDFLEVYNMMSIDCEHYYVWSEDIENNKTIFYKKHIDNMRWMISRIDDEQKKLGKKIY